MKRALWAIVAAVVLAIGLHSLDGRLVGLIKSDGLPGDVRRELQTLQQFGAIGSVILVGLCILLLDVHRRGRVLWLALATGATALVALGFKMLIGRVRPRFEQPDMFLGPFGMYPLRQDDGTIVNAYSWQTGVDHIADLWSMPSSHTAAAAALSTCLWTFYPRLRPLGLLLIVVVGTCRLLFDSHYLTDVIVGGCVGYAVATLVLGVGAARSPGVLPAPEGRG